MRPTSAFIAGWILLAAPVAGARLGLWGHVNGRVGFYFWVALVLLGGSAFVHAAERLLLPRFIEAEDLRIWRRTLAAILVISLLAQWTAFWFVDMRHARFQVVLLGIPIAAFVFPIFRLVAARRRFAVPRVAGSVFASRFRDGPERWFALADIVSRTAGAGVLHGIALAWPLLVIRSQIFGCSSASDAYELTQHLTMLALFSIGPNAIGALLEAPVQGSR